MRKEPNNIRARRLFALPSHPLKAAVLLLAFLGASQFSRAQEVEAVPYNQNWKYEQSNLDLGTAWKEIIFDDSGPGWGTGIGPLGFAANEPLTGGALGVSGLAIQTVLNRTTNGVQPRTYYFRTTFVFNGDPGGVILVATNLIDDAAVFYLNGAEVARVAFPPPPTPILFTTEGSRAASDVTTYGYDVWTNTAPPLVQGVNTYAVEVHQTGGNSSDLVFATRLLALIPTPIVITQQPTNRTVPENRVVNLTVGLTGSSPSFQWYKDSALIADATNQTFTISNTVVGDTGDYFVIITNYLGGVTSQVARLTVVNDTNGPVLLSVKADDTFQRIILTWDEIIAAGPVGEFGNYIITDPSGGPVIVSAADYLGNIVVLHVPTLLTDTNYSIEVDFQTDLIGNPTVGVGNPVGDANGIATNFHTFTITRGFTKFQAYLGLPTGESIAQFVAMPVYPNNPTFGFYTNVLNWPQTANPNLEQYAMRFSGLFVAAESGTHRFDPAHDDAARLRIYASEDQSGAFSETEPACCTALTGGPTLDVDMVAGQRYYYELIVREFGGGDYAGIAVTLPSGAVSIPVAPQYLAIAADVAAAVNVGIAQQPQNQIVQLNHAATFSVVVTNVGSGASFQWQRQPSAGGGFSDVTNGNGATYITPLLTFAESGDQYRVLVSVPGRTIVSGSATVTVVNDPDAPHVTTVTGGSNTLTIFFDEAMNAGAVGDSSNYELTDSANTVFPLSAPVVAGDNRSVTFTTPNQILGELYTLHAEFVPDAAGNALAATNIVFRSGRGFVLFQAYDTASTAGNAVSLLTSHPNYPNNPRDVALIAAFDSRIVYPDDSHEQYGGRISGWFVPATTDNYIFYNRSDDASEMWLSTDNNPANRVKIQEELGCCNGFSVHPSAPKALVGGQAYFIELLWKEGTGGDFGQVAVKKVSDPTPADSLLPISGAFLSAVDPQVSPPAPRLTVARSGGDIVFTWAAGARLQCTTSLTPPVVWQDIDTGGATSYTVNPSNEFNVNLDSAQENNSLNTSPAKGSGTVTLSNNVLVVDVSYAGLQGTRNNSHFHAPAPRGQNASVAYDTASIDSGNGQTSGTIRGVIPLVDNQYGGKNIAAQIQDIRNGLWYLNVHSTSFGGGEIRGQVDPGVRFYRLISP